MKWWLVALLLAGCLATDGPDEAPVATADPPAPQDVLVKHVTGQGSCMAAMHTSPQGTATEGIGGVDRPNGLIDARFELRYNVTAPPGSTLGIWVAADGAPNDPAAAWRMASNGHPLVLEVDNETWRPDVRADLTIYAANDGSEVAPAAAVQACDWQLTVTMRYTGVAEDSSP